MAGRLTRTVLTAGCSVAVLLTVAGCGGGSHPKAPSSSPTGPAGGSGSSPSASTPGPSGTGTPADPATVTAVTNAFVVLFNGAAPIDQRLSYLQNANTFQQALAAQAGSPLIKQTSAVVSRVSLVTPGQATVSYTVSLSGVPALANQTGTAILVDGSWKVSAATFCALLTVAGQAPSACTQASVTALPS